MKFYQKYCIGESVLKLTVRSIFFNCFLEYSVKSGTFMSMKKKIAGILIVIWQALVNQFSFSETKTTCL